MYVCALLCTAHAYAHTPFCTPEATKASTNHKRSKSSINYHMSMMRARSQQLFILAGRVMTKGFSLETRGHSCFSGFVQAVWKDICDVVYCTEPLLADLHSWRSPSISTWR